MRQVSRGDAREYRRDDDGPGGTSQAPGWNSLATWAAADIHMNRRSYVGRMEAPAGSDRLPISLGGLLGRIYSPVTVFGDTGFLGRRIVRQLADGRIAVRHPSKAGQITTTDTGVRNE